MELLLVIFGFADGGSLLVCCRVSRKWNKLIKEKEEIFFQSICKKNWKMQRSLGQIWKSTFLRVNNEFFNRLCSSKEQLGDVSFALAFLEQ